MNDLISRQDAVKAIKKMAWENDNKFGNARNILLDGAKELDSLPSAQPEVRTQMSSADLISRQDAIDACLDGWNKGHEEILADIRALPSAQPERKKGEWIPTIIAKPPKAGQYLVTKQQKTGACQIATAHYNPSFDEWSGNGNFKKILAWQPLPSPYTQE